MQTYVLLVNFTDQGMRNIKDTIKPGACFRGRMAKKSGADSQGAVLDDRPLRS